MVTSEGGRLSNYGVQGFRSRGGGVLLVRCKLNLRGGLGRGMLFVLNALVVCVGLLLASYSGVRRMLLPDGRFGSLGVSLSSEPNAQVRFQLVSGLRCVICSRDIGCIICHVLAGRSDFTCFSSICVLLVIGFLASGYTGRMWWGFSPLL